MLKLDGYIYNKEDAILVFYAILLGYLKPVKRRLTSSEKEKIESGHIYCFLETIEGMKRWTDGRNWSPSKISGDFLVYMEVPKYYSKSSIQKRKQMMRSERIENEKIIFQNKTVLCKKTINFSRGVDIYHIIAYSRSFLAKHSLKTMPFFKSIKKAIELYPEIISAEFISKLPKSQELKEKILYENYGIITIEMSKRTPTIQYPKIEELAISALNDIFNMK